MPHPLSHGAPSRCSSIVALDARRAQIYPAALDAQPRGFLTAFPLAGMVRAPATARGAWLVNRARSCSGGTDMRYLALFTLTTWLLAGCAAPTTSPAAAPAPPAARPAETTASPRASTLPP